MSSITANLTSAEISALIWDTVGSSREDANWWIVASVVVQGVLVSMIFSKTVEYYEHFYEVDRSYVKAFVGFGTISCLAFMGARMTDVSLLLLKSHFTSIDEIVQAYKLIYNGEDNVESLVGIMSIIENSYLVLGAIFNFTTGSYYVWRAYKMSHGSWYFMPFLVAGLITQLVVSSLAASYGFQLRTFSLANLEPMLVVLNKTEKYYKIWGATTLSVDGLLFVFMTYSLVRYKSSVFRRQGKLFKKLIALLWETMLPPVLCLIILEIKDSRLTVSLLSLDWSLLIRAALPMLYYHALLHTLVGRHTLRKILEDKLVADGVDKLSGNSATHSRVYATYNNHFTLDNAGDSSDAFAKSGGGKSEI